MATITKLHLADKVYEACGGDHAEAVALVDATLAVIKDTLGNGEDVLISGFGKFHIRDKKARNGRNPKTGEGIVIVPRRVVMFHAAATLRNRCKAKVHPKGEGEEPGT